MSTHNHTTRRRAPRAFSIVEMLIALTISATLLTATLAALDSMFKHYRSTTDSASTHVISRIVMHRMLTMIRTGSDFGPIPADVLNPAQNPVLSNSVEFVSERTAGGDIFRITRIEFRPDAIDPVNLPGSLWYILIDPATPAVPLQQRPMIDGVLAASFTLHFDEQTWRLDRAEIDMTIEPNDNVGPTVGANSLPQTIRLIASASPRQLF